MGEVCSFHNGDRGVNYPKPEEILSSGIPFINAGHLQNNVVDLNKMEYISTEHYTRMGGAKLQPNDILFCLRGSLGKYAIFDNVNGALASSLCAIRASIKNIDVQFLFQFIGSNLITQQIDKANNGSSQPNLSATDVKEFYIHLPTFPEQQQIGKFFRTLDEIIAKHERKLEGLLSLKKAYLQQMFPQEGESVPRVRFAGFSGEWREVRLGEVAEFSKGSGYSKSDLTAVGSPIILYGRLYTNYETVIDNVDTFTEKKDNPVISQGDEVIVPSSGETAEDIARASAVSKSGIILGGDLNIIKPNSEINSAFLAIAISNGNQQKELSKKAQGKSVVHLRNSDLQEIILHLPTLPEQTAIGTFFRTLDTTITLHQRKLESLRELKRGYLQKMFPQEGESVPRVRFSGFCGEWVERKLGEYSKLITKGTTPKITTKNCEINFVKVENISDGKITPVQKITIAEHEGYLKRSKLCENDILFSIAGTLGRLAIVDKSILPANTNQALAIIRGYDFDTNFLFIALSGRVVKEFIKRNPTIGAQPNLSLEQIGSLIIATPSIDEQHQIGTFFRNLDKQITKQSQKVAQLKKLKAAYLQKMFI